MATEKNITMREFNGTDYDILYPKTIATQIPDVYSKTEILTTETLAKYGLTADKLPNDVFQQIKTLIDNAQSSIDSSAKIQTGSYVGTGTYGADNPCSLTFDFEPKLVLYFRKSGPHEAGNNYINYWSFISFIWLSNVETYLNRAILAYNGYSSRLYTHFTLNGNTLSFYGETSKFSSGSNTSSGINDSNTTYFFVGIG